MPDGGKAVAISGDTGRHLALPVSDWQRTVTTAGGALVEEIDSRESGMEVPADSVSSTGKAINEAMSALVHVDLASSYPQRWANIPNRATLPAVGAVREIYDQRIVAKPDDAARLADRAGFRESLFDWNGEEEDYGKAIAIDPTADRYLARASIRSQRADHAGALADAKAAYALEDGNTNARDKLASELAEAGQVDEALDLLAADPDVTTEDGLTALLFRIDLLEKGERYSDAMVLADELIRKRGRSAQLLNTHCWYRGLRNEGLDQALSDCNTAIQLSSDPATFLDSRGMVNFRAGRLAQASADYAAALAASPDIPSSLFMSGIIALRQGKAKEGNAALSSARTIYPDIDHFYQRYGIKP